MKEDSIIKYIVIFAIQMIFLITLFQLPNHLFLTNTIILNLILLNLYLLKLLLIISLINFTNYQLILALFLKITRCFLKMLLSHSIRVHIWNRKLLRFSLFVVFLNEILLGNRALNLLLFDYCLILLFVHVLLCSYFFFFFLFINN
jgi:hypothetical protein